MLRIKKHHDEQKTLTIKKITQGQVIKMNKDNNKLNVTTNIITVAYEL